MPKANNNIVAGVVLLFVPMIYFFGVYQWKVANKSDIDAVIESGNHLYFVSFSSAFYAMSMCCFLLSKTTVLKAISSSVSSLCAVILYQEVIYRDDAWTVWSYWFIAVVAANYFLFYVIIEKYKKSINHG